MYAAVVFMQEHDEIFTWIQKSFTTLVDHVRWRKPDLNANRITRRTAKKKMHQGRTFDLEGGCLFIETENVEGSLMCMLMLFQFHMNC